MGNGSRLALSMGIRTESPVSRFGDQRALWSVCSGGALPLRSSVAANPCLPFFLRWHLDRRKIAPNPAEIWRMPIEMSPPPLSKHHWKGK
jgi:hypothetical protein